MADKKISELTVASTGQSADIIPTVRAGTTYQLSYEMPLFKKQVSAVAAVVNALSTASLQLVAGTAGYTLLPCYMTIIKAAGAYTLGSAIFMNVKWSGGGGQLMQPVLAGFLDQAGVKVELDMGPGNGSALYSTLGATNVGNGSDLNLSTTANTSGAGGDLAITMWYRLIPTA